MKNQVKEILNREIALQNELKAVVVEKEQLAINVLADAEVLVRELGCAHLLSTNTDSIVNVAINKGKVVEIVKEVEVAKEVVKEVVKEVEVKVEDTTRIDELTAEIAKLNNIIATQEKKEKEYAAVIKDLNESLKKMEAEDNKDVLVEAIKAKDKYIVELEEQLSNKAYNAAEKGYLIDGVEVSLKAVQELQKEIDELQEANAELEAELEAVKETTEGAVTVEDEFNEPGYQEILENAAHEYMNNSTDECLFIADDMELENNANKGNGDKDKQIEDTVKNVLDNRKGDGKRGGTPKERLVNEFNNITDEDIDAVTFEIPTGSDNKEESKQEESEVKAPEFVKEVCAQVGKNMNAKLYQTESCLLIASSTTKEMTWIADGPISDEYKAAVEQMLVAEKKILPTRVELSPVIVQTEDGYMARAKAANGVDKFADEDVVVGYVKIDGKFYLYSYGIQYRSPGQKNIKSLDAILNNDPIVNPDEKMCARVTNRVWKMKKQYLQEVKEMMVQKDAQAKANSDARKEKKDKRKSRFQANTELVLQSGIEVGKKTSKLTGLNVEGNGGGKTAVGQMVDDFAASLF